MGKIRPPIIPEQPEPVLPGDQIRGLLAARAPARRGWVADCVPAHIGRDVDTADR